MFKALIVEDNLWFQKCLSELLQTQYPDIRIVTASDGTGLVDKIEDLVPDVVFMDVKLPGCNGIELTRKILKAHSDLPIVIMTSHHQLEYREAAHAAGAIAFIQKDELGVTKIKAILKPYVALASKSRSIDLSR